MPGNSAKRGSPSVWAPGAAHLPSILHPGPHQQPLLRRPAAGGKGRDARRPRELPLTSRDAAGLGPGGAGRPPAFLREAVAVPAVGLAAWRGRERGGRRVGASGGAFPARRTPLSALRSRGLPGRLGAVSTGSPSPYPVSGVGAATSGREPRSRRGRGGGEA